MLCCRGQTDLDLKRRGSGRAVVDGRVGASNTGLVSAQHDTQQHPRRHADAQLSLRTDRADDDSDNGDQYFCNVA
jgi:hypothetical protein